MDYKILGLLCVFLIAMSTVAFAAAPTITNETRVLDPDFYEGTDRNYFGVNPTVQSGEVRDADFRFLIFYHANIHFTIQTEQMRLQWQKLIGTPM